MRGLLCLNGRFVFFIFLASKFGSLSSSSRYSMLSYTKKLFPFASVYLFLSKVRGVGNRYRVLVYTCCHDFCVGGSVLVMKRLRVGAFLPHFSFESSLRRGVTRRVVSTSLSKFSLVGDGLYFILVVPKDPVDLFFDSQGHYVSQGSHTRAIYYSSIPCLGPRDVKTSVYRGRHVHSVRFSNGSSNLSYYSLYRARVEVCNVVQLFPRGYLGISNGRQGSNEAACRGGVVRFLFNGSHVLRGSSGQVVDSFCRIASRFFGRFSNRYFLRYYEGPIFLHGRKGLRLRAILDTRYGFALLYFLFWLYDYVCVSLRASSLYHFGPISRPYSRYFIGVLTTRLIVSYANFCFRGSLRRFRRYSVGNSPARIVSRSMTFLFRIIGAVTRYNYYEFVGGTFRLGAYRVSHLCCFSTLSIVGVNEGECRDSYGLFSRVL